MPDTPTRSAPTLRARLFAMALLCTAAPAGLAAAAGPATDPNALRGYIAGRVGGVSKLQVPASNADIPVPRAADGTVPYRYETTEAKRYLGKMLFHDPVRTVRINKNKGQPVDLPRGTAFGGTISATGQNVAAIVQATSQTGSCGSCHIGEAATKAGQLLNFNVGGEGRGFTDAEGNFFPRRRVMSTVLTQLRTAPLFQGDALVDALPTLTDVDLFLRGGQTRVVPTTPAAFAHAPLPRALLATGRLDQLDSVGRESPSVIGFAFNNRLLLGGFAGEPPNGPGALNPFNDPAQENLTLLLLDAHRMLNFQSAALQRVPAIVRAFETAFPVEAQQWQASGDPNTLINDQTVFRAVATFLRTTFTRNTPFDRFLAGDNTALTDSQRRGALLFFTPAAAGGAGCFSCHSGPMLNKQPDDPDVTGVGAYVEQNFFNVGIGDHPVQALNAQARGRLNGNNVGLDGFPYHAEDTGRQEITHKAADAFKFRSLTLRQLRDARNFFHNGSLTTVRQVVEYFNRGIPQDRTAGAAPTLSPRFTHPRGPNSAPGLGLTPAQVNYVTDFLENGLYDPGFVTADANSGTDTFQPNAHDLTYSLYHPELAAAGARDGFELSGLAVDDNDALARRDQGLEWLDVTTQCTVVRQEGTGNTATYRITNRSGSVIDTHLLVVVSGLPEGVSVTNASGTTTAGEPYRRLFLRGGVLAPNGSLNVQLAFSGDEAPTGLKIALLSGQGKTVTVPTP